MEAFLISTVAIGIAEIGDKTQLLALILAARFRRPWPIVAGMFVATLANHALAAELGALLGDLVAADTLRWLVGIGFIAMGLWTLIPDKAEDAAAKYRFGPFLTTLIAFFLVEIGDKTQIATVVLAARYEPLWAIVAGTTAGMMAANVPVVVAGHFSAERLPLRLIHSVAAALFIGLGLITLLGEGLQL